MIIDNLMKLEPFINTRILAGHNGLENRVLNATFIDAPDGYKWCKKGDFIVTTGYPFTNTQKWQNGLMNLMEKLAEKKCAGLGIKLGRYVPELPIKVITYANKKKIPIISLPNNLSWTDVIVPIITYINKQHKYELEMTHKVYEKFHNHLKIKEDLHELAHLLSSIMKYPVTIYIRDFDKIIYTHENYFSAHEIEFIMANLESIQDSTIQRFCIKDKQFTVRWIYNLGYLLGGIFLWEMNSELQVWEKAAIEQTAAITALEIEKIKTISKTFQQFRNDFLTVLLEDKDIERDVILRRGKELNWNFKDEYRVVLMDCKVSDISNNIAGPIWQKKISVLDAIENELKWFLPKTLIGFDSKNRIVLLIPKKHSIKNILQKLKRLIEKINITSFYGGIGRLVEIEKLSSSYKEAIIAFKVAHTDKLNDIDSKNDNQLYLRNYYNLDVERILYSDTPWEESNNISKQHLEKVIDYDKKRDGDLLNTLKVFIDNNSNYDITAERLFIHKNTVRYRINTIKNLTNLNPSNLKDLLLLQLAIKTYEMNYSDEL